jgi:predicted DNA-binding ribbon-helix-helix protein
VALIRKTMRVGGRETCVGLEAPFWACLTELAAERRASVRALIGEVAATRPEGDSLASALRVFALERAGRRRRPGQRQEPGPEPEPGPERRRSRMLDEVA